MYYQEKGLCEGFELKNSSLKTNIGGNVANRMQ